MKFKDNLLNIFFDYLKRSIEENEIIKSLRIKIVMLKKLTKKKKVDQSQRIKKLEQEIRKTKIKILKNEIYNIFNKEEQYVIVRKMDIEKNFQWINKIFQDIEASQDISKYEKQLDKLKLLLQERIWEDCRYESSDVMRKETIETFKEYLNSGITKFRFDQRIRDSIKRIFGNKSVDLLDTLSITSSKSEINALNLSIETMPVQDYTISEELVGGWQDTDESESDLTEKGTSSFEELLDDNSSLDSKQEEQSNKKVYKPKWPEHPNQDIIDFLSTLGQQ